VIQSYQGAISLVFGISSVELHVIHIHMKFGMSSLAINFIDPQLCGKRYKESNNNKYLKLKLQSLPDVFLFEQSAAM
jgi:hypothetical protein